MRALRTPFFSVNPKSYIYGEQALKIAKYADSRAEKYDIDVFFTAQLVDIPQIKRETRHLILCAQHMDGIVPGRGMGHVLPEALVAAGVEGVILNHAEKPMTIGELVRAVRRAKELGLIVTICADSVEEVRAVATLQSDIMICEETSHIGTGVTSDLSYMAVSYTHLTEVDSKKQQSAIIVAFLLSMVFFVMMIIYSLRLNGKLEVAGLHIVM